MKELDSWAKVNFIGAIIMFAILFLIGFII